MIQVLLAHLFAYLLANFIIIPNRYIKDSQTRAISTTIIRTVTFFLASCIATLGSGFLLNTIWISILVFITTFYFERGYNTRLRLIMHQLIQIGWIILFITIHYKVLSTYNIFDLLENLNQNLLLIMIAYVLCLAPCNVVIKYCMTRFNFITQPNETLLKAGRYIGNIERTLTLTLVLINQYEALGFLITAKSLLRLKDTDQKNSEYILIGTLLSFGLALMIGIVLSKINK